MPYINRENNKIIAIFANKQFEGQEFIEEDSPEYIANQELKQEEIQARKNITKRQMLIWLFLNKQKTETDILNAIDTISDNSQKYLALVNYNGTNEFYYGNEFVSIIGQALGLTTAQIKTMFDDAKSL